jgi:hypothetical protein
MLSALCTSCKFKIRQVFLTCDTVRPICGFHLLISHIPTLKMEMIFFYLNVGNHLQYYTYIQQRWPRLELCYFIFPFIRKKSFALRRSFTVSHSQFCANICFRFLVFKYWRTPGKGGTKEEDMWLSFRGELMWWIQATVRFLWKQTDVHV